MVLVREWSGGVLLEEAMLVVSLAPPFGVVRDVERGVVEMPEVNDYAPRSDQVLARYECFILSFRCCGCNHLEIDAKIWGSFSPARLRRYLTVSKCGRSQRILK